MQKDSDAPSGQGTATDAASTDHERYWASGSAERQAMVKRIYDQRDPKNPYATSRDHNQRELEISALRKSLANLTPGRLVDLGCGNGYSLIELARTLPGWSMEGVDLSETMIEGAEALLGDHRCDLRSVPTFQCGDAVAFAAQLKADSVDVFITERFLLNLPERAMQRDAIQAIFRALAPGGLFLMCEASKAGFRELNRLREAMGLEATLETSADNISAIRFEDDEIESFLIQKIGFELIEKQGFSIFFIISRVLHPALIAPDVPQFEAKINHLGRVLQEQMPFEPGIGSNVLWVLRKPRN